MADLEFAEFQSSARRALGRSAVFLCHRQRKRLRQSRRGKSPSTSRENPSPRPCHDSLMRKEEIRLHDDDFAVPGLEPRPFQSR
jgi:hypothetical protein